MMPEKENKPGISKADLIRRNKGEGKPEAEGKSLAVSAGVVGPRIVDFVFNPTREKIREVTVVNQLEAQLLPQIDVLDTMWQYVIEVALFRQDADEYERIFGQKRPIPPNPIGDWVFRKAQWNKSIGGKNLQSGIDITLAETEARTGDEEGIVGGDAWKD